MHRDLDRPLEEPSAGQPLHSTVCIVGGGIAGLILARQLANRGIEVHLLEAGGLEFEERSQTLYQAEMASELHRGTTDGRFRTFGGSSTRWGGQLQPFTSDVFDPPPGSPSLPWPIKEQDLTPYYDELQRMLGVDLLPFSADLLPALGQTPPPKSPNILIRFSKWIPFRRRNLARTIGPEVLAHPRITVFTHANTTSFSANPQAPSQIHSARVVNYAGREFTFTADHFIVAAGTIESSRLLLCSPGVPNPHDQIGRYFHDHVAYHAAQFESPVRERILDLVGPFFVNGTIHSCKLEASPEIRGKEKLYSTMAHVVMIEPEDSGVAAVRNLLQSLQRGRLKEALVSNFIPVLRGTTDVFRLYFYSRFKRRRAVSKRAIVRLNIDVEQAPDSNNRIRLSPNAKDSLGIPVAIVDWHINPEEMDTATRFAPTIREFLASAGVCPQDWHSSLTGGTSPRLLDTNHAMGGLRMGEDPATSVVDRNLTVHGLTNLHIASCAVFPSGGCSGPTFTMMALAMRLADHLATQIIKPASSQLLNDAEAIQAPLR